jgi:hypothetical protein
MTFSEVANDADLRIALKTGEYFYAEVPGDAPDSIMRLVYFTPNRFVLSIQTYTYQLYTYQTRSNAHIAAACSYICPRLASCAHLTW